MSVLQQLVWRLMRVERLVALTGIAAQYEADIARFERATVKDGAIVFFGSSSFRFWSTLAHDMAPLPVVNAGFGGAHAAHLRLFWQRVLPRHRPRAVVVYAGDNDLAAGTSVDAVAGDLAGFVDDVAGLCPVVLLTVKRSPQRAHLDSAIAALNGRIDALAGAAPQGRVTVVDVDTPLHGLDGRPERGCFRWDGLHLSPVGYARWAAVLRPVLLARFGGTPPDGQGQGRRQGQS